MYYAQFFQTRWSLLAILSGRAIAQRWDAAQYDLWVWQKLIILCILYFPMQCQYSRILKFWILFLLNWIISCHYIHFILNWEKIISLDCMRWELSFRKIKLKFEKILINEVYTIKLIFNLLYSWINIYKLSIHCQISSFTGHFSWGKFHYFTGFLWLV